VQLAYVCIPRDSDAVCANVAQWTIDNLNTAIDVARDIVKRIRAGEFPLMIGIHFHHTERLKQKGCPLDWVVTEPGYNRPPIAIALARNAPHSAAGKLFIDFILSRDGQKAIQNVALRYPVRSDVELSGELLKLKGIRFWDSHWDTVFRNIDSYQKSFRQTFGLS